MSNWIEELRDNISIKNTNIRQICAMKDNKVVFQENYYGFKEHDTMQIMSVTKSVVSLLIGIAIDQGLIKDEEQYVLDFFPGYVVKRGEKTIKEVKIKHLLTMTAPYKYKSEPWKKVCTSTDWTKAALDILGGRSGITGEFKYATLGIQILMGIITNTSKMTTIEFANKYLFLPLGINKHENNVDKTAEEQFSFFMCKESKGDVWYSDSLCVNTAGWGLCLAAVDMAKIGQMVLNKGKYNETQIVSENWINKILTPRYQCDERFANMAYSYLWWIIDKDKQIVSAIGDGGNVIYINPQNKVVVGITATFKPRVFDRVQFIQKYIEPYITD